MDAAMATTDISFPRFAFHHPWPPNDGRHIGAWMKSMLLFFDGVALLVPSGSEELVVKGQSETVIPLIEMGLLRTLDPARLIDREVSTALLNLVLEIATSREREFIYSGRSIDARGILYHDLTGPRSLDRDEREASRIVWEEMQRRGFASHFGPDDTILVDPDKWGLILAFLAQALRPAGLKQGLDLQPATDDLYLISSLIKALDLPRFPSAGHVLTFDLEQVSLDLTHTPIHEVLEFRERHGEQYRAYTSNLQRFAFEISALPVEDREASLIDRHLELADEADRLKRLARTWWRRPVATIGVGMAGAVWSGAQGDWASSIISLLGGIVGAGGKPDARSAYSYLFKAQSKIFR